MGQPRDLGEVWSLCQKALDVKPGDCFYTVGVSGRHTLGHVLMKCIEVHPVSIRAQVLGDMEQLFENGPVVEVAIWTNVLTSSQPH